MSSLIFLFLLVDLACNLCRLRLFFGEKIALFYLKIFRTLVDRVGLVATSCCIMLLHCG